MSTIEKSIQLYAWKTNYQTFQVVQGEANSRKFNIQLFDTVIPVDLTNCTVMFYAAKPDSTKVYIECEVVDAENGLASVTLTDQMCVIDGTVDCWVQVIGEGGTDLRFEGMNIEVSPCPMTVSVESSDEIKAFLQQSAKLAAVETEVKNARVGKSNLHDKQAAQDKALTDTATAIRQEITVERSRIDNIVNQSNGTGVQTKLLVGPEIRISNKQEGWNCTWKHVKELNFIKTRHPFVVNAYFKEVGNSNIGLPIDFDMRYRYQIDTSSDVTVSVFFTNNNIAAENEEEKTYNVEAYVVLGYDCDVSEENNELTDLRIGTDGVKYSCAGEAVRQQIGTLTEVTEQLALALPSGVYTPNLFPYAAIGEIDNRGNFTTKAQTNVKVDIPISDIAEKCVDYLEDKLILNIRPDPNGVYQARLWYTVNGVNGYKNVPDLYNWIGSRIIIPFASITSAFLQIARVDGAAITNKGEAIQAISITVERLWETGELSPDGEFNRHAFAISQYLNASMDNTNFNGIAFPVMPGETLIVDGIKLIVKYRRFNQNFEYIDGYNLDISNVEGSVAYIKDSVNIESYSEGWISRNFIIPDGVRYIVIEKSSLSDDMKFYLDTRPVDIGYDQHCVSSLKGYYPRLKNFKGQYDRNNDTCQYISNCGNPPVLWKASVDYRPYLNGSPGDFWIFRDFKPKRFANTIARYGDVVWFDGTALRALRNPYAYGGNETTPNAHYDIVIVGGGAGGVGAAYALCNSGLRVCLIEKQNGLGGTHTSAGVLSQIASPIGDWYKAVAQDAYNWAAMRCGSKSYASSDESETTFDKLWRGSQHNISPRNLGNLNLYNPYYLYQKYHEDLTAGGIEIRYNREFISCKELNGTVISATFRNLVSGGEETVSGDYFIDCTGDCYLARYNKVLDTDFFIGSDPASRYNEAAIGTLPDDPHYDINTLEQVYLYSSYNSDFDIHSEGALFTADSPYAEKGSDLPNVAGVTKGQNSAGVLPYYNHTEIPPHSTNGSYYPGLCNFVSPDYYCGISKQEFVDNGYDVTRILAENKAKTHYKLSKKTASTFFIETMPMLAIREGYRMKCEYMVTQADVETTITSENYASKHIVALSSWYVDIHQNTSVNTGSVACTYLNGIPYEAMIPCTQKNVLVACRGYGASHIGLAATRLTKTMLSLGYAAGKALLQARSNWLDDVRNVDVAQLQSDIDIAALLTDIETNVLPAETTN